MDTARTPDDAPRDRDSEGRPHNDRPRDALGRPLPHGAGGVDHGIDVDAPRTGPQALAVAQQLIDDGFPFAAHEVLEARWKQGPPDERGQWQGLAQVCVGLTHLLRGNRGGAERVLTRARITLTEAAAATAADAPDASAVIEWIDDVLAQPSTADELRRLVLVPSM